MRRVESETGTRVQFITGPDITGPTRDCKISGTRSQIAHAKAEIEKIIVDNDKGHGASQFNNGPARGASGAGPPAGAAAHQPPLREGEDTMQIMVPDRTVGLIIGRRGETIQDLQERSGCHINIVGEQKSQNGLRPVNLIGTPQASAMAKELIMEIVESDVKSGGAPPKEARGGGGGGGGSFGGGFNAGGGRGQDPSDKIMVPSDCVGMIIGKGKQCDCFDKGYYSLVTIGGETIRELQNTSGCKINVNSNYDPSDPEREIGLVGSREAIEQAKIMITDKVEMAVSYQTSFLPGPDANGVEAIEAAWRWRRWWRRWW
jgi:far upstream element-binding protein